METLQSTIQMNSYSIKEIFYSLQGEGKFTGTPAVFIRFAGCNLKCPFCDTDFKDGKKWTIWEIDSWLENQKETPPLVILTGGEPTLQADDKLCSMLHKYFRTIAIETNGTNWRIPLGVDFVTVSPKEDYTNGACSLEKAGEVKVVFNGKINPEKWKRKISADYYFLQPCDTGNEEQNKEIVEKCVEYIKGHPWWRLSLQTQKILNIR